MAIDTGFDVTAYDISLYGGTDSTGSIQEVYGKDALSNAVMMWLTSARGDILRNPSRGGVLLPFITKPMSEAKRIEISTVIQGALQNDFEPFVILQKLEVIPDYERRKWKIEMDLYSPQYKVTTNVQTEIKNLA